MEIKAVCEVTSVFPAAGCVCNVCVRSERGGLLRRTGASLSTHPPLPRSALLRQNYLIIQQLSVSIYTSVPYLRCILHTARTPVRTFSPATNFSPSQGGSTPLQTRSASQPASHRNRSVCVCVGVCFPSCVCVCSSCRPRSVPSASVQPCTRR